MVCKQMVCRGGIPCVVLQGIWIALWTLDLYSPGPSPQEAVNSGFLKNGTQSGPVNENDPHFKILSPVQGQDP